MTSLSPRLVLAGHDTQITVKGSNFQKGAEAGCLVGDQLFPAEVTSSTTALCLAGPSTLRPLIYQIKVGNRDVYLNKMGIFALSSSIIENLYLFNAVSF